MGLKGCTQFLDPYSLTVMLIVYRNEMTSWHRQVFWLPATFLLSVPSHPVKTGQWLNTDFVTDYSGGTAPDFHGIPY